MSSRVIGFLLAVTIMLLGAVAWTVTSSQALGSITPVTPTYAKAFAVAELAKPTYTPSPIATIAPTETPTNTPEAVAEAVIVDSPIRAMAAESQAEVPVSYSSGKYILVDISEQHMYVYEGDLLVYSFIASTGMNNATRTGTFSVLDKIPNAYGATWDLWMPNWLGIYWAGSLENGIHALPILSNGATLWSGFLGSPISYGCVVLDTFDAQVLYEWAEVGVPVEIQW
ncbi:MAG: L,D-transpeptidase [Anaerolineales bacterium]|nr:L,D-transpeptidase [Anaerolineales bacterium]